MDWDRETDVLVFGSGAAGMTAALVAALEGFQVFLCEKAHQLGGTTATSAGTVWIPCNHQSARAGQPDSMEAARTYLERELGPYLRADLLDAFLSSGPEAIDYLETHSHVVFDTVRNHPDYHADEPGGTDGRRALTPRPFDGRRLGRDFELVRPPRDTLLVFGGMMVGRRELPDLLRPFASVATAKRVAALLSRHFCDRLRYRRGTRLILGNALIARFLLSLREQRVAIETGAALVDLVRVDDAIEGAVVSFQGVQQRVRARRAVVLATGGFPANPTLRAEFFGDRPPTQEYGFPECQGDALRIARSVGAAIDTDQVSPAWWTPVSVLKRPDGSEALWAHAFMDRPKPGLIAVNRAGKRFVNEGDSYHDFALGMLQSHKRVPSVPAFLICDRRFVRRYGLGMIRPIYQNLRWWEKAGYIVMADTVADLARKIGVDPVQLEATVSENNASAIVGVDTAFGKGSRRLNIRDGDPSNRPNPCLGPIERPPFVALPVHVGIIGTSVGIATDADARVRTVDGGVLHGLYACGNDMGSVMRGAYPGPGITLGPAITFAYRAIMNLKRRNVASL